MKETNSITEEVKKVAEEQKDKARQAYHASFAISALLMK